jgi:hypothetical protein
LRGKISITSSPSWIDPKTCLFSCECARRACWNMEDVSPLTRHDAAFTLGQLGYRSAVPVLVHAVSEDASPIVRHESAVALSSIGDYDVLPQLEKVIEDKDEDVSNSALIALEYLSYLKRKRKDSDDASRQKIRL